MVGHGLWRRDLCIGIAHGVYDREWSGWNDLNAGVYISARFGGDGDSAAVFVGGSWWWLMMELACVWWDSKFERMLKTFNWWDWIR